MALPRTRAGRPRLRTTDDVLSYWIERIERVAPEREYFSYCSMICRGDSLYHYGEHFELACIMRDKRGRTRLVLLNGDSYGGSGGFGPSTSSRQADVRQAVARTSAPHVVVPFSALEGAGIDFKTIMPINVRSDRFTTEEHSSRTRPAKLAQMPSGAMETETYWAYDHEAREHRERTREVPVYVDDPDETVAFRAQHGWCEDGARRGEDGIWRWSVERHWLGDSIFRARSTERRTRRATPEELRVAEAHRAWENEAERLARAEARARRLIWQLERDSRNGRRDYGRMVRLGIAEAGFQEARARHYETRPPSNSVRDDRVPITVTRWATYLSSFDYQEARPLYFLCQLPGDARPGTVDEAIEALKPPEVVAAEARGLKVIRQGDLFAIPTKLTKRQLRRMRGRRDFEKRLRVLGTNHSVSEGIVCKGGAVFGRGVMRHEPEGWRPPDHARKSLGDRWHLLVRNTVPRSR